MTLMVENLIVPELMDIELVPNVFQTTTQVETTTTVPTATTTTTTTTTIEHIELEIPSSTSQQPQQLPTQKSKSTTTTTQTTKTKKASRKTAKNQKEHSEDDGEFEPNNVHNHGHNQHNENVNNHQQQSESQHQQQQQQQQQQQDRRSLSKQWKDLTSYACPLCNQKFNTDRSMMIHYRKQHPPSQRAQPNSPNNSVTSPSTTTTTTTTTTTIENSQSQESTMMIVDPPYTVGKPISKRSRRPTHQQQQSESIIQADSTRLQTSLLEFSTTLLENTTIFHLQDFCSEFEKSCRANNAIKELGINRLKELIERSKSILFPMIESSLPRDQLIGSNVDETSFKFFDDLNLALFASNLIIQILSIRELPIEMISEEVSHQSFF